MVDKVDMDDKMEMVNIIYMTNKMVLLDMLVAGNIVDMVEILVDMVDKVNMENMLVDTTMVDIVGMMVDNHVGYGEQNRILPKTQKKRVKENKLIC